MSIETIKGSQFSQAISSGVVVVEFFAEWCGPCRNVQESFEESAETYKHAKFIKVDVDEADEVAETFEIESLPTFMVIRDGEVELRWVGSNPTNFKAKLSQELEKDQPNK